jgi:hypothetical protein
MNNATTKEESKKQYLTSPEKRECLVPRVRVAHNNIITSAHSINTDHMKLVMTDKDMSERQVVVCAGEHSWVKKGDWVKINTDMFRREKKPGPNDVGGIVKIYPPIEDIEKTKYLYLTDRHIKYVIEK